MEVSRKSFGNIKRSLIDIWKGEDYASFRALLRGLDDDESTALPEPCKTCHKAQAL